MNDLEYLIKNSHKLTLLYVEDNKDARETTLMILKEFFDNIVVGIDGEDGYEKFIENKIDLIIADINMPRVNGLEMLHNIMKIDKDIPAIILSAHNETEFLTKSIELGIKNFLFKPIDIDKFINVLKSILEHFILLEKTKLNEQLLHEYQDIIDESTIVSKTNLQGEITYVNDEFCKIYGYTRDELIGVSHSIIKDSKTSSAVYLDLWDTIGKQKRLWRGMLKNISKDGTMYHVKSTIKPILNNTGNVIEYISLHSDVTELINLHSEIKSLHAYDTQQQLCARDKLEVGIVNHMNKDEARIVYAPLDILSGDFYSIFKRKDGSKFIYLIDGQGHGISPALTVFSVSSTINNIVENVVDLEELVDTLFPTIKSFLGEIEQLSYTMILISKDSKTISYCSGGMYPFLIKSTNEVMKIKANNIPFMNFSKTPTVEKLDITHWKSLVIYSDGLREHECSNLDEYTAENIINEVVCIDKAKSIIESSSLDDDITILHINNV